MAYTIKLEKFEGPLDLLLQLIERQKLDITEISLSAVTEQYLRYIQTIERLYPEELADFLVVATKLLLLKSRLLLPALDAEDEDEGSLADQLRLYKKFIEVAGKMQKAWNESAILFSRPVSKRMAIEPQFIPPQGVRATLLKEIFMNILEKLEPVIALPAATIEKVMSLREKMEHIKNRLRAESTVHFHHLFTQAHSRGEVIVTFLAILELMKQQAIVVEQSALFSNITIRNNKQIN